MAYDYTGDIAFANEIIADFGRAVSFTKITPATVDPVNPLANSAGAPVVVSDVMAAFVFPSGDTNLGQMVSNPALFKSCEKIALVAADGTNDFTQFDILTDTDGDYKIETAQAFRPGLFDVLYFIGINRP